MHMRKNIFLLFFSGLVALCLAEIIVRYQCPQAMSGSWFEFSDRGYYTNKSDGTSQHQFEDVLVTYQFYPPHLRDTRVNPAAKHLLTLGDSFTFGMLLPQNNTFIYHLQTDVDQDFGINQYQFLNAAAVGWGTADYLAYLEEYGEQLAPQFVIVFLNTDDIARAMRRNIYLINATQLTNHFHPLPHAKLKRMLNTPLYNWLLEHVALLQLIRTLFLHQAIHDDAEENHDAEPVIPYTNFSFQNTYAIHFGEALFHRINLWCQAHHAKLLVITTGFNAFYPPNIHDPTKVFLAQAQQFFSREGIPYYDMAIPFKNAVGNNQVQIPKDQHPNALGAYLIAKTSWPWIKQQIELNKKVVS